MVAMISRTFSGTWTAPCNGLIEAFVEDRPSTIDGTPGVNLAVADVVSPVALVARGSMDAISSGLYGACPKFFAHSCCGCQRRLVDGRFTHQ